MMAQGSWRKLPMTAPSALLPFPFQMMMVRTLIMMMMVVVVIMFSGPLPILFLTKLVIPCSSLSRRPSSINWVA